MAIQINSFKRIPGARLKRACLCLVVLTSMIIAADVVRSRHGITPTRGCSTLAASFHEMLEVLQPRGTNFLMHFQRTIGLNVTGPAETKGVRCNLTEETTVRGLYDRLAATGVIQIMAKCVYDFFFYLVYINIDEWGSTSNQKLSEILVETSLGHLDHEGIKAMAELVALATNKEVINIPMLDNISTDTFPNRTRQAALCGRVWLTVKPEFEKADNEVLKEWVKNNTNVMRAVTCRLLGVSSIQEAIHFVDHIGLTDYMLHAGYKWAVEKIATLKADLEKKANKLWGNFDNRDKVTLTLISELQRNKLMSLKNIPPSRPAKYSWIEDF